MSLPIDRKTVAQTVEIGVYSMVGSSWPELPTLCRVSAQSAAKMSWKSAARAEERVENGVKYATVKNSCARRLVNFGIMIDKRSLCSMPTALDREGYKYYFYSNEHMPEHVHVKNGSGKAKFDISDGVQLVESKGMKIPELKRAQEIAEEEVQLLKEKWHEFFD